MSIPDFESNFNPQYSSLKFIFLEDISGNFSFKISQINEECQFERVEMVENINEIFPNGSVLVRDLNDITTFIKNKNIEVVKIQYFDGTFSYFDITSVVYVNNAASETEENFISINFSNRYYKYLQSSSLVDDISTVSDKKIKVYKPHEFFKFIANNILITALRNQTEKDDAVKDQDLYIDEANNFILYRPYNTGDYRIEMPADNAATHLNYISSFSCGSSPSGKEDEPVVNLFEPRFVFWTDWKNRVNFKYFNSNIEKDIFASKEELTEKYLRFAIYNSDVPVVQLTKTYIDEESGDRSQQSNYFRKIYHLRTDPSEQFISKNYYYVRKTPKFLDNTPIDIKTDKNKLLKYTTESLMYHYQDEGQKFNIEFIGSTGPGFESEEKTDNVGLTFNGYTAGAEEIVCGSHWGFYDKLSDVNSRSHLTLLSDQYGTDLQYGNIFLAGKTGYMPYVDNANMWKNMFDITEIHPNYPDASNLSTTEYQPKEDELENIEKNGHNVNLKKINDIRYKIFENYLKNYDNIVESEKNNLELIRKIEKQNFIMYVLCCMSKEEESFFALLTEYERDKTYSVAGNEKIPYRYNWVKLNFDSPYGLTGPVANFEDNVLGRTGNTYWMHHIERWSQDSLRKGSTAQDDTWAINLNEHGLTSGYLPPGWVKTPPVGFDWRPIGVSDARFENKGTIHHIVKMNVIPMTDLLLDSKQMASQIRKQEVQDPKDFEKTITTDVPVYPENYIGKYLYYFTATNIVDGTC